MKWVNPPVAYMLHAGLPLLLDAGVHLFGLMALHAGDAPPRGAGGLPRPAGARSAAAAQLQKATTAPSRRPDRLIARKDLVNALELGQTRLACASSSATPSAMRWCRTPAATAWTPCCACCKPPGPSSSRSGRRFVRPAPGLIRWKAGS